MSLKIWKKLGLFTLGGGAYVGLELLWRGRSHGSMFAAGGLCFLLLGKIGKRELPLAARLLLGAAAITAVELAAGLLVNRDFAVWDYRSLPGNFLGQICPLYSCLWLPVAWAGMELYRAAEKRMH
ncbi:MAG: hypothetical protein Q4F17_03865 [Eubacteriales bacterium]|nr:hypothetical protein [Eubacteriales bacterium]